MAQLLPTIGSQHFHSSFSQFVQKLTEMALLYSKELTTAKKVTPVGLDLMQEIITGLGVQCLTN